MGAITFEYGDPKQTGVDAPTRGTLRAKLGTREVADGVMRTTATFDIVLVEGGNVAKLSDTGPNQYWEIRELAPIAGRRVWYKKVSGDSAFADLEDVDPDTFLPFTPAPSVQQIVDGMLVGGEVVGDDLILTTKSGDVVNAGNVRGADGQDGTDGIDGTDATVTAEAVAEVLPERLSAASIARLTTAPAARSEGKSARGMIALIFDDNWLDQYTLAAPALEARGFKATFVVNPVTFGGTNRMTAANVADLAARGHEIGNHTQSHVDMTTQTAAERAAAWDDAQAAITSLVGKPATTFAYPFNKTSLEIDQQCYLRFDRAFTGNAIPFVEPLADRDTFLHGRWAWSNDTSSIHTRALNWVRLAAATDVVFTLFAHHILDATTASDGNILKTQFIELLDLAVSLGVPIVPANVAFPKFDRLPDAGHESTNTLYHRVSGTNATNTYTSVVLTPPPVYMAGARCKRFTGDGTATLVDMQDVYIPVRSSEPLTLSARFRQTRASGNGSRLVIKEYDSYGTQIGADITSPLLNTTFDWQQVTLDYTPSATARSFTPGWRQELMSGTTDVDHMCIDMKRRPALG